MSGRRRLPRRISERTVYRYFAVQVAARLGRLRGNRPVELPQDDSANAA
jgi:hypothetical protein